MLLLFYFTIHLIMTEARSKCLVCFLIVRLHLQISCKNLYSSYVHIYIFTVLFYHSLDNYICHEFSLS